MAQDVERLVIEDKGVLPEELSDFGELVVTDTERLYGIDAEGKRQQLSHLAHVVINFAAKASGAEVESLPPAAGTGRRQERGRQPDDIEAMVQRMVEERISAVTQAHEQQTRELQTEIEGLRAEIERLQKPLGQRLDEDFGDNWVPRQEEVAVARRGNDGYLEDDWTTTAQPYEKDGKWYINIKKNDSREEAELPSLIRAQETPAAEDTGENPLPANLPEGSRPVMRRRSRLAMWGDNLRRQPVREYEATGAYATSDGYLRVVDGEVVEVTESDLEKRDGIGFLGGAAVLGAGMVIGATVYELLEHKYMGHSPSRELRNNGVCPWGHLKGGGAHEALGGHGAGRGTHTDFYNPAPGHRRTAVEGSATVRLTGDPGNKTLKDGDHVILRHVQWTKEGLLSKLDRMRLRDKGYHVDWGKLQDTTKGIFRYKSVVSR